MPSSTSDVLEDVVAPNSATGNSRAKSVLQWLTLLVTRFNTLPKFHPSMIARLSELDMDKNIALVIVPRTRRMISIKYDKSQEQRLSANVSELIEIGGKIRMDEHDNPVAVCSVKRIESVDTRDIAVSEVLPDFLLLTDKTLPLINVELDETKRFYCAELEDLNLFACGLSRGHLKEQLRESLEICWDEFVREDGSDLSQDAWDLREKL